MSLIKIREHLVTFQCIVNLRLGDFYYKLSLFSFTLLSLLCKQSELFAFSYQSYFISLGEIKKKRKFFSEDNCMRNKGILPLPTVSKGCRQGQPGARSHTDHEDVRLNKTFHQGCWDWNSFNNVGFKIYKGKKLKKFGAAASLPKENLKIAFDFFLPNMSSYIYIYFLPLRLTLCSFSSHFIIDEEIISGSSHRFSLCP